MGARMSWHRVTFFFVLAGRKYLAWNCEPWSVTFRNARPRSTWSPVYIPILAALTSLKYMNVLRIVTDLSRHKIVTIWMVPLSPPTLKVRSPLIVFCCLSYIYDGHFVTSHCITHTTSYWEVIENFAKFSRRVGIRAEASVWVRYQTVLKALLYSTDMKYRGLNSTASKFCRLFKQKCYILVRGYHIQSVCKKIWF